MQILLVEDDDRLASALADVLGLHGFAVARARDGERALELLAPGTDVVVLDLGLPDRDGFEVCTRIRQHSNAPIIMATARGDLPSRVHGLHLGADDYLVKPFDVRELMARIHAVGRRARARADASPAPARLDVHGVSIDAHGVTIDVRRRTVLVADRPIPLARKEFDLLALLARSPGVVFRREQILSAVWQSRCASDQRTLEVHVASIRAKTGRPGLIETVRGVGYRLATGSG